MLRKLFTYTKTSIRRVKTKSGVVKNVVVKGHLNKIVKRRKHK